MNKELSIIIFGRVIQVLIMLITLRTLTTFLSPDELGNYYLILGLLTFFNLVLLNPPGMYFTRHLLDWQNSENLLNALVVFVVWIFIASIFSVIVSIIIYNMFGYSNKFELLPFLLFIFLSVFISTIHRNMMYGTNSLGFRKEFVIYMIFTLILGFVLSVLFILFHKPIALDWLFGIIVSEILMLYSIYRFFIQNNTFSFLSIKNVFVKNKLNTIFNFTYPIALSQIFMWGQGMSYRFIVDFKYSTEILAYIAVGMGISSAIFSAIENISMQYFNPIFLKKILNANKQQRTEAWNSIAKKIVPIYLITAIFIGFMAEILIKVLVDETFYSSYIYILCGISIDFFRVMTNLLNNVSQSEKKTRFIIQPYFIGFLFSITILSIVDFTNNYFMIPLVLSIASCLIFIFMYINMKKLLNIKYRIDIFKVILLSLPFFMVKLIDIDNYGITLNIFILGIFGIYFLFATWMLQREKGVIL